MKNLYFLLILVKLYLCQEINQCDLFSYLGNPGEFCYIKYNGCRYCEPSKCLICLDGFYKYSDTQCKSCQEVFGPNVKKCNQKSIEECNETYYLNTNQCIKCPDLCKQCTAQTCSACVDGSYLENNQCKLCNTTNSNCCQTSQNICQKCNSKFYLDNNTCKQCIANCDECTDGTTCNKCSINYIYYNKNKICLQNPSNCKQACFVDQNNNQNLKCVLCKESKPFYYSKDGVCTQCNNNTCKECDENCIECISENKCLRCKDKFTLLKTSENKEQCVNCQTNCSRCQMDGSVKKCYECMTDGTQPTQPTAKNQCLKGIIIEQTILNDQSSKILSNTIKCLLLLIVLTYY